MGSMVVSHALKSKNLFGSFSLWRVSVISSHCTWRLVRLNGCGVLLSSIHLYHRLPVRSSRCSSAVCELAASVAAIKHACSSTRRRKREHWFSNHANVQALRINTPIQLLRGKRGPLLLVTHASTLTSLLDYVYYTLVDAVHSMFYEGLRLSINTSSVFV